ncbi:phospholipase A2 inhibitor and Ly6/PLAUR domain-containing protein-like [Clarias gariepinus]|uniref:phospholipase A2 inhibitor and Ly6/PLAUR domain-containing protein-like n=1 Tax=Clarias gariepinus TaxID=13013 RepID=UPI00234D49F6|nr:phospholipase A2 inhibitor and Ly6/PLAUR domain-containing protein-like [Clarias gariepinus]
MKSQVTLLLVCLLFSKVFSLTCVTDPCESTDDQCRRTCSEKCVTMTSSISSSSDGTNVPAPTVSTSKSCSGPKQPCTSFSLNTAAMKVKYNTKCCSTDLCNSETLPAPSPNPNGRMCYTCNNKNCTIQVKCEGDEYYCFNIKDETGQVSTMKGCSNKGYCSLNNAPESDIRNMECCQGNLCNSAEIFTLRFLLLIIPLFSSTIL